MCFVYVFVAATSFFCIEVIVPILSYLKIKVLLFSIIINIKIEDRLFFYETNNKNLVLTLASGFFPLFRNRWSHWVNCFSVPWTMTRIKRGTETRFSHPLDDHRPLAGIELVVHDHDDDDGHHHYLALESSTFMAIHFTSNKILWDSPSLFAGAWSNWS